MNELLEPRALRIGEAGWGYSLSVPFPPTVNWMKVSEWAAHRQNKAYRKEVWVAAHQLKIRKLRGRLTLTVTLCAPDRRRYDLDNRVKSLQDALKWAGCYEDDSQIDELVVRRGHPCNPGTALVRIWEFPPTSSAKARP